MRTRSVLRLLLADALYRTGVLWLLQRVRLRRKAVVLMYHRVLTNVERQATGSHPGIVVSDETFARHLAVLRRRFKVLTVDEFAEHIERRVPFPDSSCLITFDDGWADNRWNAWPRLREAGLPALIFLSVNFIGSGRMFWRESLTSLITQILEETRTSPERRAAYWGVLEEARLESLLDLADSDPRRAVSEALGALKGADSAYIDSLLARLSAILGAGSRTASSVDRFMTWPEVQELASDGVTFGGHGAEHVLLDRVPASIMTAEVASSMAEVSRRVPAQVPTFSYPNGNWTEAIAETVRSAGFRLAFTTGEGRVAASDDRFALRRVNISEDPTCTAPLFLARILGVL